MITRLHELDGQLVRGTLVDRPNRFVLRVRFDAEPERVYLGDPGALEVLTAGDEVVCRPATNPERSTDYDAIAVDAGTAYVSLRAAFANTLFAESVTRDLLPAFEGYSIEEREPPLPEHGRTDFRLRTPSGASTAFVEVKSCTHAEAGIGKFPDRPTERGRRHLRALQTLIGPSTEAHLVLVAQRADVDRIKPYRVVDPDFADRLVSAVRAGVQVHGMTIGVAPPIYSLVNPDTPVVVE